MADRLYRWTLRLSVGAVAFFVFLWAIVLWPLEAMLIGELISNHHPPPVAGGVITSDDGRRSDVVDSKLTVALQKQFPVGTAGAALRSVLLKQGFRRPKPPPYHPDPDRSLVYHWSEGFTCDGNIMVEWNTDDADKITGIKGSYWGPCL